MVISAVGGVKPGKVLELERRLFRQLIVGRQKASKMADELDQELESIAFKLDIERAAVLERIERQQKSRETFQAVSAQLTDTIMDEIAITLSDMDRLIQRSHLTETQLALFEQLCKASPDMGRIRLLMNGVGWLSRDLTNVVNSTSFRQRHPQRADVQVTDIKLVLNFIGVENLRQLVPYYSMRNWLPTGHSCLLWTNRKLWQYSLMCATAARALARLHQRNETLAFVSAMLEQFGITMVLGSAAAIYEKNWGNWLREASASRDKELYDAVMATEFPAEQVLKLVFEHSSKLAWAIPARLKFDNHEMVQSLKALDETLTISELPLDAQILAKASCYAQVTTLEEARLLEPQEARLMYRYYGLSEQEVIRLSAQNYRKMDLF
ncbi:HDOD domain-containing protein [Shewanella sp.]|uniref:HDOD domain-containing protein n=1 Tax=Shewanella sp. TaxID=50422 RepID=UPI003561B860